MSSQQGISLEHLNKKQREAVQTTDGPILVLAGPGSGKTKTLTYRIAHLIKNHNVLPENILAVTFTNKAAEEMQKRIRDLLSPGTLGIALPFIGTFHRFCVRLLRHHATHMGFTPSFSIYDADDQDRLIKKIIAEENIDKKRFTPGSIKTAISHAKNTLQSVRDHLKGRGPFQDIATRVAKRYQSALKQSNAMDFDDLITISVKLLRENDDIRNYYQEHFHYIHVDEYQDTNTAQYELIRLLAGKHKNLFVVGDDAQSIYSWRAADFRNILNFETDYPNAHVIMLEQNYRSTQPILSTASALIRNNTQQKHKDLWTARGGGELVVIKEVQTSEKEGETIVTIIRKALKEDHKTLDDIAILYRTNVQSRSVEEALINNSIPYRLLGSVRFFDRREIRDLLAYLSLFHNTNHLMAFTRIVNTPRRGIGPKTIAAIQKHGLDIVATEHKGTKQFSTILRKGQQRATTDTPHAVLMWLLKAIDYRAFLKKTYSERNIITGRWDHEERWNNVQELFSMINRFQKPGSLGQFLEEAALFSSTDDQSDGSPEPRVTLMTLHAAKGLEFPIVVIVGCEEGLLPHANSLIDPLALEEERRLCYVGITRAMDVLYLLHARQRLLYGRRTSNPASRFLEELPDDAVNRERLPLLTMPDPFDDEDDTQWI